MNEQRGLTPDGSARDAWRGEPDAPRGLGARLARIRAASSSAAARVDGWRRGRWVRRSANLLSIALVLGGLGLMAYPFATNMFADIRQRQLRDEFGSDELRRAYVSRTIRPGEALTRIRIEKLGVDAIVVEGTTPSALRAGAGHYERTALPCEPGNSGIAGHRTTYSKPFARLHELRPGDRIVLETPIGRCWYEVERAPWITDPYDWSIVGELRGRHLTLTTCNPPGSASERLVVRARLVRSELGAAGGAA